MAKVIISPEEQLKNLADIVLEQTQRKRALSRSNRGRRGQAYEYPVSIDAISDAARQLAESVKLFLAGELNPVTTDDDAPF